MLRELQGLPIEWQESLTDREREVVTWVMRGRTNKEIAMQLAISEKTVKAHLRNIFPKLKVSRRAQLCGAPYPGPQLTREALRVSPAAPPS
jgi:DNA-binding CsgD family transcriptional regulator